MTHIGRFSQYQTNIGGTHMGVASGVHCQTADSGSNPVPPSVPSKMRDQFSRNRSSSGGRDVGAISSLAAREAEESAAPHSNSLPVSSQAADKPDTIPPLVVSGALSQTHAGVWHQMLNTGAA